MISPEGFATLKGISRPRISACNVSLIGNDSHNRFNGNVEMIEIIFTMCSLYLNALLYSTNPQ